MQPDELVHKLRDLIKCVMQGEGFGPSAYLNPNDATGTAVIENKSALAPANLLAPGPSASNHLSLVSEVLNAHIVPRHHPTNT